MNYLVLSFTIALLLTQIKQNHCYDKESSVFDTVLSNPLENHANSKVIDLESHKVKSRRRRYVAFPEGSSFSVCLTNFLQKLKIIKKIQLIYSFPFQNVGCFLRDCWVCWQSAIYLFQLGSELGLRLRFT